MLDRAKIDRLETAVDGVMLAENPTFAEALAVLSLLVGGIVGSPDLSDADAEHVAATFKSLMDKLLVSRATPATALARADMQ